MELLRLWTLPKVIRQNNCNLMQNMFLRDFAADSLQLPCFILPPLAANRTYQISCQLKTAEITAHAANPRVNTRLSPFTPCKDFLVQKPRQVCRRGQKESNAANLLDNLRFGAGLVQHYTKNANEVCFLDRILF